MSKVEVRCIVFMPLYELEAKVSGWWMENSTDGIQESLLRKRYQDSSPCHEDETARL
jgi:hypothetical protein